MSAELSSFNSSCDGGDGTDAAQAGVANRVARVCEVDPLGRAMDLAHITERYSVHHRIQPRLANGT